MSLAASQSGIGDRLTFPSQRQTSVSPRGREAANQGFRTLLTKERLIGARDTRAKAQRKVIYHPGDEQATPCTGFLPIKVTYLPRGWLQAVTKYVASVSAGSFRRPGSSRLLGKLDTQLSRGDHVWAFLGILDVYSTLEASLLGVVSHLILQDARTLKVFASR
jgi:hypothetical protein